jgi:hypothetical protein
MCHGGPYKRLLYTQGKGYVRNGDPDLDDPNYSSHVLIMKDKIQFIGNIYTDASFLVDPTEGEDDDAE